MHSCLSVLLSLSHIVYIVLFCLSKMNDDENDENPTEMTSAYPLERAARSSTRNRGEMLDLQWSVGMQESSGESDRWTEEP